MAKPRLKITVMVLLICFLGGMVPSCNPSSVPETRIMSDAMLLSLASHEAFENELVGELSGISSGNNLVRPISQPALVAKSNPHQQLAQIYNRFAQSQSTGSATRKHFEDKAVEHLLLAEALTTARARNARRRGRGFQRFIRGLARAPIRVPRAIARATGKLLKGTFRVVGTVVAIAVEQIPQIARDMVMQKLKELRDLAQGKIELTWDKVAAKLGAPFALWLRSRIDPAFVRLRDRFVAKVLGRKQVSKEGSEGEEEQEERAGEGEATEAEQEALYGTWEIAPEGETDDMGGYIKWAQYWTGLPSSFEDDCLVGPEGTKGATIFTDDVRFLLSFELDQETIHGTVTGSFTSVESEQEEAEGSFESQISNGWIRPAPGGDGWEFGGSVEIDMPIQMELQCLYRSMTEGGTIITPYWRDQSNSLNATATLSGEIYQLVPGEGDEPDHLAPGGELWVDASIESEGLEMTIYCLDCEMPADFPPPFIEGDID